MDSFALFSLPYSSEISFIKGSAIYFQDTGHVFSEIEKSGSGFLVHPFHMSSENKTCFIKGKIENWNGQNDLKYYFDHQETITSESVDFIKLTQKAIDDIKAGNALKIVTSRTSSVKIETDILSLFKQLKSAFENCFVCLFSDPEYGTWISASPEILLNYENSKGRIFSMAGTKNIEESFTSKEKDEQKIVTDFILKTIRNYSPEKNISTQEKEIAFGSIKHLLTEINISSETSLLPLAFALHPTPAVGGMEKEVALEFILKNENFRRNLYTGFWGPVFSQTHFSFYVNLRTMKISSPKEGMVYAGAGITALSDAEKEWRETERKTEILVSAFKK